MKKLIASLIAVVLTVFGLGAVATLSPVAAESAYATGGANVGDSGMSSIKPDNSKTLWATIKNIINVITGVVGVVAVVMVVIGGFGFMTSQGDAAKVTKARNTILYGVIGIIVVILAYAIVNFVITGVNTGTGTGVMLHL